jgi:hypothetical protein
MQKASTIPKCKTAGLVERAGGSLMTVRDTIRGRAAVSMVAA